MLPLIDTFQPAPHPRWITVCTGGGTTTQTTTGLRLGFPLATADTYTDAQLDDYTMLTRSDYPWRGGVRLRVIADFSHDSSALKGTAGFGFWNNPFSLTGKVHALPEAAWFFYSAPPSEMLLVPGLQGWGWKAQVVHARRAAAIGLAAPMAAALGIGRFIGNYRLAGSIATRLAGAAEAVLVHDLKQTHIYQLEWHQRTVEFFVDGELVMSSPYVPTSPLGFVAWIDNQYAVARPDGTLRFGTISCSNQWMNMREIHLERL